MPAGSDSYHGLAVPLYGESNVQQIVDANDILTLTKSSGSTGDYLVLRTAGGGEQFVFDDNGNLQLLGAAAGGSGGGGITLAGNSFLKFSVPLTTRPTTGLDKGDLMLLFHGSRPIVGICSSSAANTIKMIRLRSKTFGRLTA